eukprot:TRINITY_DN8531_c0_g1_i1.p1 TRINITY_DN8531_c0_g1~~TRINITY_DN8531_c0_g1_i1.p1  ORF type:complete len:111 (-),score=22.34 TRINITY_DN8531_c0_g1_i1:26-358(-)
MRVYPPECCTLDHSSYRHSFAAEVFMFGLMMAEAMERKASYHQYSTPNAVKMKLKGLRPELEKRMKHPEFGPLSDLIIRCWSASPDMRPSFSQICEEMKVIIGQHQSSHK